MKRLFGLIILCFFLTSTFSIAGNSENKIQLNNINISTPENILNKNVLEFSDDEVINGKIYRIVQFNSIPHSNEINEMKNLGLEFIFYQPKNAYFMSIPTGLNQQTLANYGVRSILRYEGSWKLSEGIINNEYPDHAKRGSIKIEVVVSYPPNINHESVLQLFELNGVDPVSSNGQSESVNLIVDPTELSRISEFSFVYFIAILPEPGKPENNTARSLHNSSAIHPDNGAGRDYDGAGVNIQIQDNSPLGTHIDKQGRIDNSAWVGSPSTHGAHVSGTVMGAGNLNPLGEGMASGAFVFSYGPSNLGYNAVPNLVANQGLVITQKSYSNGCNAGYTSLTRQLDQQVNTSHQLVHVFSAGNSNGANCGYGAGNQWGNVTGGHKIAKNAIATANVSQFGQISGSSSRGPANDGRIKPDISAKGSSVFSTYPNNTYATISGTSMASPGIAGTMAQLYQAYRDNNGQADPSGGLMKSIMLNTATDVGVAGPDFIYGWGVVNGMKAVDVIENNLHMTDTASQGDSLTYSLTVPAGLENLRVMLYWADMAASVNSNPSLVNDLEFRLYDGSGTEYKPWVLDHTPNASTLSNPAIRAEDHLNNMEQVTLANPPAGTYTMVVKGLSVPMGPQAFFINHIFETDDVKVTYPIGSEAVNPSENIVIRWDAYGNSGTFQVEYSLDSGSTWTNISSSVLASRRYLSWSTPSTPSPNAMVRVTRGSKSSTSELPFSIMQVPGNLNFSAVCTDSAELSWNPSGGAFGYVVRQLGVNYMDSIGYTTSTSFWVQVNASSIAEWFTVNAVGPGASKSRRAIAKQALGGAPFNCPETPIANFSAPLDNICVGRTVPFTDESINLATSWAWTVNPGTHTYVNGTSATSQNPEIQFTAAGSYDITMDATNSLGTGSITKLSYITTTVGDTTRLNEDFPFTVAFPPNDWEILNPDGDWTWIKSPLIIGSNGASTTSSFIDNYPHFINGHEDRMIPYVMDLINFQNPILLFDLANAERNTGFSPTLRVEISDDCGNTFQPTGYEKSGSDLATVIPVSTSAWVPTNAAHWRTDTIDISAWIGSEVRVSFVNISSIVANNIFIDNIRIVEGLSTGLRNLTTKDNIKLFPIPASDLLKVQMEESTEDFELAVYDLRGKRLSIASTEKLSRGFNMDVSNLPSGTYLLEIYSNDNNYIKRFVIE